MISNVLFEARREIERYLTVMPEIYTHIRAEVDAVCTAMATLQMKLDNPFFDLDGMTEGEREVQGKDAIDLTHDCLCAYWRGTAHSCTCGKVPHAE